MSNGNSSSNGTANHNLNYPHVYPQGHPQFHPGGSGSAPNVSPGRGVLNPGICPMPAYPQFQQPYQYAGGRIQRPPPTLTVHVHDVLSGRGVNIAHHPGNERFRSLVTTYQDNSYCTAYSASEKRAVAQEIIKHIHNLDPPGRFLKRDGRGQVSRGLAGPWQELSEREAIKKTCQALRDCNRTDRTGYANGVAAPKDVVKEAEKVAKSGLSAKERAAAAAAASAANAASLSFKRARDFEIYPPSNSPTSASYPHNNHTMNNHINNMNSAMHTLNSPTTHPLSHPHQHCAPPPHHAANVLSNEVQSEFQNMTPMYQSPNINANTNSPSPHRLQPQSHPHPNSGYSHHPGSYMSIQQDGMHPHVPHPNGHLHGLNLHARPSPTSSHDMNISNAPETCSWPIKKQRTDDTEPSSAGSGTSASTSLDISSCLHNSHDPGIVDDSLVPISSNGVGSSNISALSPAHAPVPEETDTIFGDDENADAMEAAATSWVNAPASSAIDDHQFDDDALSDEVKFEGL